MTLIINLNFDSGLLAYKTVTSASVDLHMVVMDLAAASPDALTIKMKSVEERPVTQSTKQIF